MASDFGCLERHFYLANGYSDILVLDVHYRFLDTGGIGVGCG